MPLTRSLWLRAPVALTLLAGTLLAGCDLGGTSASPTPVTAPTSAGAVGLPPLAGPGSSITQVPGATQGPPCLARDLQVTAGWQGATGALAGTLQLTNTGQSRCVLVSSPKIRLATSAGPLAPIAMTSGPGADKAVVLLAPGARAMVHFEWRNWCGAAPGGPIQVQIGLPLGGGSLRAPAQGAGGQPQSDTPRCDAQGQQSTLTVGPFQPAGQ